MKRTRIVILALLLSVSMLLSLSACGGDKGTSATPVPTAAAPAGTISSVENPSNWFGWIRISKSAADTAQGELDDVWAYIDNDPDGKTFFELYRDGNPEEALLSMYITLEDNGTRVVPVIGEEDAWMDDTYMVPEETKAYTGSLSADGALTFQFDYVSFDGANDYYTEIYLHEDGSEWPASTAVYPPHYDEYMAAMASGGSTSEPAASTAPASTEAPAGQVQKLPVEQLAEIYKKLDALGTDRRALTYEEVIADYFGGVEGELYNSGDDWKTIIWESAEDEVMQLSIGFKDADGSGVYYCSGNMGAMNMKEYLD